MTPQAQQRGQAQPHSFPWLFKIPKHFQELFADGWLERFFAQTPADADRVAHLFQVCLAARAVSQVGFEPRSFDGIKRVLQILGYELHEFLAAEIVR
jgi:hypothetical protein